MNNALRRYNETTMTNVVNLSTEAAAVSARERAVETRLLERVRDDGDRDAFEELFRTFTPRLAAWVAGQGCEPGAVDAVVQEVMITSWTRAHQFDAAKASARTWIYTVARNRLIDHHRAGQRRRRAHDELTHSMPEAAESNDRPERGVNSARLAALLEQLPAEQSEVVLMLYIEGHTHREIATLLELPIGTVKSRARLAFQRLRKLLEEPA